MINNEVGAIEPVEEISKIVKDFAKVNGTKILYHVDAIQAYGKVKIFPHRMGIDALSVSGHKIHGPKGVGFLFLDENAKIKPIIYGGGQQKGMRSGTMNVPGIAGLGVAAKEAYESFDERIAKLNQTYHMDLYEIPDAFHPLIRSVRDEEYQEFVLEGGRGSTKSSNIAQIIVELIKNNHDVHAIVCRKVGNTLKDSVYSKIKWAITKQHLTDEFEFHKSPLEITYKPTGQKIYFRGADEPEKIKSISPEFGYIGILWYEEVDQFFGEEEIRNITQSAIRGGDKAWIFKSFNPPKTINSWINKYIQMPKDNMLVHHSTYLDVPKKWLGQPFIDEAEHLKELNPAAYEHEYGGVPTGTGSEVFDNLESRRITDEEIASFDHIYRGVDWGWEPDPFQYIQCHYDSARMTIYIYGEFRANKMSNEETADTIRDMFNLTRNDVLTCDSAEKKSIADYRSYGLNARAAEKGPDSVRYGMKWLQSRVKIIIDPVRCPNAWKEFSEYEYEKTRDGEPTGQYPDMNNHTIDAIRYALESVWKRRGQ